MPFQTLIFKIFPLKIGKVYFFEVSKLNHQMVVF